VEVLILGIKGFHLFFLPSPVEINAGCGPENVTLRMKPVRLWVQILFIFALA
jgi:hypothetical protein